MLNYLFNYLKTNFRKEVVNFIFKIMAGIILVSVIVFSLIELAFSYQQYLSGYIYGPQIGILSFILIACISFVLFLVLFNKTIKFASQENQRIHEPIQNELLYTLSIKMTEGFIIGFLTQNLRHKRINEE